MKKGVENSTQVVATVNGQEYFATVDWANSHQKVAEEAVHHFGIKAKKKGETFPVKFYEIRTAGGKQTRHERGTVDVALYYQSTETEFEAEQEELLLEVPEEFRDAIRSKAWADGHSAGYEEVIYHIKDLIDFISPCLTKYKAKVLADDYNERSHNEG